MKTMEVSLELDPLSLRQVQTLARNEKKTLEDKAISLLEKGIHISELENKVTIRRTHEKA